MRILRVINQQTGQVQVIRVKEEYTDTEFKINAPKTYKFLTKTFMEYEIVILNSSGKKIRIMAKDFNSNLHEHITLSKQTSKSKEQVPKVSQDSCDDTKNDRFEELKAIGWNKLTGEERKEYKTLKDV